MIQTNSFDGKLEYTKELIRCWVDSWGIDGFYVAFSGGWDSTVLLHIVRGMYPEAKALFSNTGLEFPEIVRFVKTFDNVDIVRPKLPFHKVIEKYGWPIISKNVSIAIDRYRNTKRPDQKHYRLHGKIVNGKKHTAGVIPLKWQPMIDAPFKISGECCVHMKKNPLKKYAKKTGRFPMVGIMGGDSNNRAKDIRKRGCNVYDAKEPQSRPLANWGKNDIREYTTRFDVEICSVYSEGYDRTGCIFCMYGLQQEAKNTGSNRFEKMQRTHPKQYDYVINKLGAGKVLDYMNINYER